MEGEYPLGVMFEGETKTGALRSSLFHGSRNGQPQRAPGHLHLSQDSKLAAPSELKRTDGVARTGGPAELRPPLFCLFGVCVCVRF